MLCCIYSAHIALGKEPDIFLQTVSRKKFSNFVSKSLGLIEDNLLENLTEPLKETSSRSVEIAICDTHGPRFLGALAERADKIETSSGEKNFLGQAYQNLRNYAIQGKFYWELLSQ